MQKIRDVGYDKGVMNRLRNEAYMNKFLLCFFMLCLTGCAHHRLDDNSIVFLRDRAPYEEWTRVGDCIFSSYIRGNIFLPSEFGKVEDGLISLPGTDGFALPVDKSIRSWRSDGAQFRYLKEFKIPRELKKFNPEAVEIRKIFESEEFVLIIYLANRFDVVGAKSINSGNLLVIERYNPNFYKCETIDSLREK